MNVSASRRMNLLPPSASLTALPGPRPLCPLCGHFPRYRGNLPSKREARGVRRNDVCCANDVGCAQRCLLCKTMLPSAKGLPPSASLTALPGPRPLCPLCGHFPRYRGNLPLINAGGQGGARLPGAKGHSLRLFEPPPSKREARGVRRNDVCCANDVYLR